MHFLTDMNRLLLSNILLCFNVFIIFYVLYSTPSVTLPDKLTYKEDKSADVVIYNRIPKTGSTTFTNAVAYDLCHKNGFTAIHVNISKNSYLMSVADESDFVRNVSDWLEKAPAFYHGHMTFVDFTRFGRRNPIYINIIREPLERFVSYYYFLRYGDNFRVGLKRSRAGDNHTFDECVQEQGKDCNLDKIWLQVPYFCGSASFCRVPGSQLALNTAKYNLVHRYAVVGHTDRIRDLIFVLEKTLPTFFKGALYHFDSLDERRSHLRNTTKKIEPSKETKEKVQQNAVYKAEREFYDFAVNEFNWKFRKLFDDNNQPFTSHQYRYEKIQP